MNGVARIEQERALVFFQEITIRDAVPARADGVGADPAIEGKRVVEDVGLSLREFDYIRV